jgi:dipeptidyl aminopeptidase/acylaminoacyl peptidase
VLIAAAIVVGGCSSAVSGRSVDRAATAPASVSPEPVDLPSVDAKALHGRGSVAFISSGALWLLDSSTGELDKVMPARDDPSSPSFSADGRWLAFTAHAPKHAQRLWLVRRDDSGLSNLHEPDLDFDGWAPTGHRLAVDFDSPRHDVSAVSVLSPGRPVHTVAQIVGLTGVVWSPDGGQLAVASDDGVAPVANRSIRPPAADNPRGRTSLLGFPVDGGQPTVWFQTNDRHGALLGMNELRLTPIGWWTGQGIAFWVNGNGAVLNADQSPIEEIREPGATPVALGSSLSNREQPSVVAAPDGQVAIVDETRREGFGRLIWQDKRVEVCAPGASECRRVPSPAHTVTLDPSWSTSGRRLAYVVAPSSASPAFPQRVVHGWYAAHRLAMYDAQTGAVRQIRGSAGASVPTWSRDGRLLMYAARNGIWVLGVGTDKPVRVVAPLFGGDVLPAYYGEVDWIGQFAWSAAA